MAGITGETFQTDPNVIIFNTSVIKAPSDKNSYLYLNCNGTCEDQNEPKTVFYYYSTELLWVAAIFCILFSVLGTTGNLVSILALVRKKRLRNATTAFIVNLCVSDMFYCCFTMPLQAMTFINRDWQYSDMLCKLFALVKFSNGILSIFTIVAITVNRYVLIVYPNLYKKFYNKRNTALGICCLWLSPLVLILPPFFDGWGTLNYNPKVGDCGVNNLNGKSPRSLIFFMILILPSIIFVACYLKIYFVVKKSVRKSHRKEVPGESDPNETLESTWFHKKEFKFSTFYRYLREKKEFRVLRIVLVIFILYIVSFFPLSLIKILKKEKDLQVMNVIGYILYYSSSVMNPIIYIIMSREYRTAYKELFLSSICGIPSANLQLST